MCVLPLVFPLNLERLIAPFVGTECHKLILLYILIIMTACQVLFTFIIFISFEGIYELLLSFYILEQLTCQMVLIYNFYQINRL
jgi:hypothetical protein